MCANRASKESSELFTRALACLCRYTCICHLAIIARAEAAPERPADMTSFLLCNQNNGIAGLIGRKNNPPRLTSKVGVTLSRPVIICPVVVRYLGKKPYLGNGRKASAP